MLTATPERLFREELDAVVGRLVEHYQPQRVILFGSHVWGEPHADSDVDLMVIKETEVPPSKRAAKTLLCETGPVPFPMDIFVYTPAELERRLSLGDPFIRKIVDEGEVLYDAACQDLDAASILTDHSGPTNIICFHCQQAGEKVLKVFLQEQGTAPPRLHDLPQLLDHCVIHEPSLDAVRTDVDRLDRYYTGTRYPPGVDKPSEEDARDAYSSAEQVR